MSNEIKETEPTNQLIWTALAELSPCMTAFTPVKVFLTEAPYGWSERGQGRRFSAFISTLDPVSTTPPESSWEQSSGVFSELCSLLGLVFCETTQARFLHLNHFSMATLGSINHVFGLVKRHDY